MKPILIFLLVLPYSLSYSQYLEGVSNQVQFVRQQEVYFGLSNVVNFGGSSQIATDKSQQLASIERSGRYLLPSNSATSNNDSKEAATEIKLPTYYALVIGIASYKNTSSSFNDLDRPVKDARQLTKTLVDNYNFERDKITLLENPTRAEILDAIDELATKVTQKDNLLLFYAGHGYWDENLKVGYWLPADATLSKKSSWISNSSIKDYVSGINSKHTLLITDACFSGSIFKTRSGGENLSSYGVAKLYGLPSRKAMTSGNLKAVPDQSKFFEYLNKRLIENNDKYLLARDLFGSLYTAVLNNTSTVPLYGVIQDSGDEGGEFIFIRKE
jgi:hypothetical protein